MHQTNSCKAVHSGSAMHPCTAQYLPEVAESAICPGTRKFHLDGAGAAQGIRGNKAAGVTLEEEHRNQGRKGRRLRVAPQRTAGRGIPCRAEGALGRRGEGLRMGVLLPGSPGEAWKR